LSLKYTRTIHWGTIVLALAVAICPVPAWAGAYGSSSYGSCDFQADCASTIVTLPAPPPSSAPNPPASPAPSPLPLEVNINLTNGQVIPRSGYTIIVTPLNGAGTSFARVDFSVDGSLIHSQTPGEEGTASWRWQPSVNYGTNLSITVVGLDGQTVTHRFQVVISSAGGSPGAGAPASSPGAYITKTVTAIGRLLLAAPSSMLHATENNIRKLPAPVKYTLPYFIFFILAGDVLLLGLRARNDAAEIKRLRQLYQREQQISELKYTFTGLVSHYLRTPLTVIGAALDLVSLSGSPKPPSADAAKAMLKQINTVVNRLIATAPGISPDSTDTPVPPSAPLWRQSGFDVSFVLLGAAVFWFDFLAQHHSNFKVGQVNLIVQLVIFSSLALLAFYMLRRGFFRQRQKAEVQHVLTQETGFNKDRDQLVKNISAELNQLVANLDSELARFDPSSSAGLKNGQFRLHEVLDKLAVANLLRGTHSLSAYTTLELQSFINQVMGTMGTAFSSKQIKVTVRPFTFQTRDVRLLRIVIRTVLDNAAYYSPANSTIEITGSEDHTRFEIAVTDHGAGIPAEKQYLLFQAFSKTEGVEIFNHAGMGFSLYLDKLIMNYLVGDISVQSAVRQGTTVTIALPKPLSQTASTAPSSALPYTPASA